MIKPAFEKLPIECWIYSGRLGFDQPSICLFHQSKALGKELLDAVKELQSADCPAQRVLTFAGCSRKRAVTRLTILVVRESERLRVMNIRCAEDTATIEMTERGLPLLMDAIASWLAGAEDFGVAPRHASLPAKELGTLDRESGELWFWGPGYYAP